MIIARCVTFSTFWREKICEIVLKIDSKLLLHGAHSCNNNVPQIPNDARYIVKRKTVLHSKVKNVLQEARFQISVGTYKQTMMMQQGAVRNAEFLAVENNSVSIHENETGTHHAHHNDQ